MVSPCQKLKKIPVRTKQGIFLLHFSEKGLYSIQFPKGTLCTLTKCDKSHFVSVSRFLGYFKNPRKGLRLRNDLTGFTPFQKKVYATLMKTPAGKVMTYGDLARKAGYPKAVRAVGSVMRKNRLPLVIPCHRVIRSNGALGEYSAGKQWKCFLLRQEGAIRAKVTITKKQETNKNQ